MDKSVLNVLPNINKIHYTRGSATGLKLGGPKRQNYYKSIVNLKNSLIFSKNWGGAIPPPNSIGSGPPALYILFVEDV